MSRHSVDQTINKLLSQAVEFSKAAEEKRRFGRGIPLFLDMFAGFVFLAYLWAAPMVALFIIPYVFGRLMYECWLRWSYDKYIKSEKGQDDMCLKYLRHLVKYGELILEERQAEQEKAMNSLSKFTKAIHEILGHTHEYDIAPTQEGIQKARENLVELHQLQREMMCQAKLLIQWLEKDKPEDWKDSFYVVSEVIDFLMEINSRTTSNAIDEVIEASHRAGSRDHC